MPWLHTYTHTHTHTHAIDILQLLQNISCGYTCLLSYILQKLTLLSLPSAAWSSQRSGLGLGDSGNFSCSSSLASLHAFLTRFEIIKLREPSLVRAHNFRINIAQPPRDHKGFLTVSKAVLSWKKKTIFSQRKVPEFQSPYIQCCHSHAWS